MLTATQILVGLFYVTSLTILELDYKLPSPVLWAMAAINSVVLWKATQHKRLYLVLQRLPDDPPRRSSCHRWHTPTHRSK
jgi:hypothetical protein